MPYDLNQIMYFSLINFWSTLTLTIYISSPKSIAEVITACYGREVLKSIRKFEKTNFKRRKLELDLEFPTKCDAQKLTPKFIRFRLPNSNLRQARCYRQCQMDLLSQEMTDKRYNLRSVTRQEKSLVQQLRGCLRMIDFVHISSFMLVHNNKMLKKTQLVQ